MRLMVSGCMGKGQGSPSRRLSSGSPGSLPRSLAAPSSTLQRGPRWRANPAMSASLLTAIEPTSACSPRLSSPWVAPGPARRLRSRPADALAAHRKREQFRGRTEAEYRAWLRAILARLLADAARRIGPGRPVVRSRSSGPTTSRRSDSVGWRRRSPPPARDCCDRNGFWSCPRRSTGCRKTSGPPWRLRYLQGLSVGEVCRRMGRTPPRWPVCCIAG